MKINSLTISKKIRKKILNISYKAQSAHIASSLSIVDIITVLYLKIINKNLKNIFILSKGHACLAHYCLLNQFKVISDKMLNTYGKNNSILMSHSSHKVKGVNLSTGSLGHGLPVATGIALILVDKNGENSISVASGANLSLTVSDIHKAQQIIKDADVLLMQLESPIEVVEAAAKIASEAGVTTILNPAPAQSLSDELLKCVTILTPNESETELLTGLEVNNDTDAKKAASVLLEKGIETVIITIGSS